MGKAVFRVELAEEAHSECLEASERRPSRVFARSTEEGGNAMHRVCNISPLNVGHSCRKRGPIYIGLAKMSYGFQVSSSS